MNNVMNISTLLAANGMSFSERTSEAMTMVIMGMAMVFLVLAIIMVILMIMERFFAHKTAGGEAKKDEPKPAPKKPEPVVAPAPAQVAEDDGAIIAAITAAISAMLAESGDETYQGGFRVVSFKRSNRNTPWNSAR